MTPEIPGRPVSDESLMLAVRDGEVGRLGELFERHHLPLFDFLARMTGDRGAAEDLVQDVFVRILKYRRTYRDDSCFEAWLYRIARNARADHFKRRSRVETAVPDNLEVPADTPGPDRQLQVRRETDRLRRALLRLPDDKRELIVLAKYRGMKYERIAQLLNVEVGTVKVRIHRAIKDLRAGVARQSRPSAATEEERPCTVKKSGTSLRPV